jgi:hypothetical protein
MQRRLIDLRGGGRPLLDIVSHARGGLGRRDRLCPAQIEHISLTVNRTPEVMIKVLSQGGQGLGPTRALSVLPDQTGRDAASRPTLQSEYLCGTPWCPSICPGEAAEVAMLFE